MEYQHKSGAIKRKEKRERDEKAKRGQKKLLSYFSQPKNSSNVEEEADNENEPLTLPSTLHSHTPSDDSNVDREASSLYSEESLIPLQLHEHNETPSTSTNNALQLDIFDIGNFSVLQPNTKDVEAAVSKGPEAHPNVFLADSTG